MKFTIALTLATVASAETWKITSLDQGTRTNLCARQIQSCQNDCGGADQAPMAFCNEKTLAWGCGCLERTPNFSLWNWPVPVADCDGSKSVCRNNCNAASSGDRNECFTKCEATHQCSTENAPISYTNSTDVDTAPIYVGPAVSYNGTKLGDLNDGNKRPDSLEDSSSNSASASGSKPSASASGSKNSASGSAGDEKASSAAKSELPNGAASVKAFGYAGVSLLVAAGATLL